jgi:hypothetical protein
MFAEVKKYKFHSTRIKITFLNNTFFTTKEYIIKTFENGFSIEKPNLDYTGKTIVISKIKSNYLSFYTSKEIQDGNYILDEESNEDILFFIK